jgi:hypothetical protein
MNEKQKKLAIIAFTVIVAVILLLWTKKAGGNTIVNQGQAPQYSVSIPSLNLPPRDGLVINVPGLPNFTPYEFSPISPCMCNGASQLTPPPQGPLIMNITNMGNSGPNVYSQPINSTKSHYTDFSGNFHWGTAPWAG